MTIEHVAVIGTGVIGSSWAAYFLAKGFTVTVYDPAPNAEQTLRQHVQSFWPALQELGLGQGINPEQLRFEADLHAAVKDADFIQENAPERLNIKHELIAQIEQATRPTTIISSSSSGLLVSDMQAGAQHPERIVLGHPFNPPHLIPLVEVIGGKLTSADTVQRTMQFYKDIGKKPIHVKAERKGHVANRLQAALWREALYLLQEDVVSVEDLDTAIAHGPGLRWALLGPFINLHLSGGAGGIAHTIEHLGPPIEEWWQDLGTVSLTPELREKLTQGVQEELAAYDQQALLRKRDALLVDLLKAKENTPDYL